MKEARKAWDPAATAYALPFAYGGYSMDIQTISTLISTIGFPIAACCAIFYMMNKEREDHKQEVMDLKTVIADINSTLAALKQLIEDKL